MNSSGLGRGLSALIPDNLKKDFADKTPQKTSAPAAKRGGEDNPVNSAGGIEISLESIVPNPDQPRKKFNQEALDNLAASIKEHGLLQPIVVIRAGDNQYEIVAGERRFRACKMIGLEKIPAILKDSNELEQLELAIIENVQRENLNPIEEAKAYKRLMQEFSLTQEDISKKINKGRSSIANLLRYLTLPQEIQEGLMEGKISESHAKIIAALEDPEAQMALYNQTIRDNLSVREIENIADEVSVRSHKRKMNRATAVSPQISQKEKKFSELLGSKVSIRPSKKGGRIIIEYFKPEDLERISEQLDRLGE